MNQHRDNTNEFRARKQLEMENLVRRRNHILLEGTYINNTSRFLVYCPIHQRSHDNSLLNYKKSKKATFNNVALCYLLFKTYCYS